MGPEPAPPSPIVKAAVVSSLNFPCLPQEPGPPVPQGFMRVLSAPDHARDFASSDHFRLHRQSRCSVSHPYHVPSPFACPVTPCTYTRRPFLGISPSSFLTTLGNLRTCLLRGPSDSGGRSHRPYPAPAAGKCLPQPWQLPGLQPYTGRAKTDLDTWFSRMPTRPGPQGFGQRNGAQYSMSTDGG